MRPSTPSKYLMTPPTSTSTQAAGEPTPSSEAPATSVPVPVTTMLSSPEGDMGCRWKSPRHPNWDAMYVAPLTRDNPRIVGEYRPVFSVPELFGSVNSAHRRVLNQYYSFETAVETHPYLRGYFDFLSKIPEFQRVRDRSEQRNQVVRSNAEARRAALRGTPGEEAALAALNEQELQNLTYMSIRVTVDDFRQGTPPTVDDVFHADGGLLGAVEDDNIFFWTLSAFESDATTDDTQQAVNGTGFAVARPGSPGARMLDLLTSLGRGEVEDIIARSSDVWEERMPDGVVFQGSTRLAHRRVKAVTREKDGKVEGGYRLFVRVWFQTPITKLNAEQLSKEAAADAKRARQLSGAE